MSRPPHNDCKLSGVRHSGQCLSPNASSARISGRRLSIPRNNQYQGSPKFCVAKSRHIEEFAEQFTVGILRLNLRNDDFDFCFQSFANVLAWRAFSNSGRIFSQPILSATAIFQCHRTPMENHKLPLAFVNGASKFPRHEFPRFIRRERQNRREHLAQAGDEAVQRGLGGAAAGELAGSV